MAHALHPNYMDKHEENHQPKMHKGMVVKHNANQRYATTAVTSYLFRQCAKLENVPTQDFVVRNDMGCGSTIGPIIAAGVGIRTVDVGIPQLSMHSIREMCGTEDIDICFKHFTAFYKNFSDVDKTVAVDA
jgi:aspartyl aminopeptidase